MASIAVSVPKTVPVSIRIPIPIGVAAAASAFRRSARTAIFYSAHKVIATGVLLWVLDAKVTSTTQATALPTAGGLVFTLTGRF